MSRYLLDTNILIYLLLKEVDNISKQTNEIIDDFNNQLHISSISIMEVLQLYRIKKIKSKDIKNELELFNAIEDKFNIKILPFSKQHLETLSKLKIAVAHNDPFDHAIISHAITEKLICISSDRKFKEYTAQKLQFIYNLR